MSCFDRGGTRRWFIRGLRLESGDEVDYVRGVTTVFRASEELPWRGVRELVGDKEGNRPERHCVFADLLPGSVRILPRRHREHRRPAFGFCLLCFRDPEHPSPWDQIKLDWRELSLEARKPHEDQIRIAVGLLEKEST